MPKIIVHVPTRVAELVKEVVRPPTYTVRIRVEISACLSAIGS